MRKTEKPTLFTRAVITVIAVVQLALGIVFILFPGQFARTLGLPEAPGWTEWIFGQFGARSLGFAYGMWLVLRDARRHASWIKAMIAVQAIDWVATALALAAGNVTLANVATAPFLPVLFVIVLVWELHRQRATGQPTAYGGR